MSLTKNVHLLLVLPVLFIDVYNGRIGARTCCEAFNKFEKPTFNYVKPTGLSGQYYTVDPINSRWQGQLGVKLTF